MRRAVVLLAVIGCSAGAGAAATAPPPPPRIAGVKATTLEGATRNGGLSVQLAIKTGAKATGLLTAAVLDGSTWAPIGTKTFRLPTGRGRIVRRSITVAFTPAGIERLDAIDSATIRLRSWRAGRPRQVSTRVIDLERTPPPLRTTVVDHGASAPATAAATAGLDEIFGHVAPANAAALAGLTIELDIIPADKKLTDLPEYAYLAGQRTFDGRLYDDLRGLGGVRNGDTVRLAVAEEQLTPVAGHPAGYAIGFIQAHEAGHIVNNTVLTSDQRLEAEQLFQQHTAAGGPWLDPGFYTSSNEDEYFAQSIAAWFGHRYAPTAEDEVEYTRDWLRANDPGMAALLARIFP